MSYTYLYPHPAVTVDITVFGYDEQKVSLLLIQRAEPPFQGMWALPGGFVREKETVQEAAYRELREETSLEKVYLEEMKSFSRVDRDPRERVISIAQLALVRSAEHKIHASTDATNAKWHPLDQLPELAFDHQEIVLYAKQFLMKKVLQEDLALELMPPTFTLTQAQEVYEALLEQKLDKRNFRKKILASGYLSNTGKKLTSVAYRAPDLYKVDNRKFKLRRIQF